MMGQPALFLLTYQIYFNKPIYEKKHIKLTTSDKFDNEKSEVYCFHWIHVAIVSANLLEALQWHYQHSIYPLQP